MMPVKPPASTAMFVSVARSSSPIAAMPSPANSSTLPIPCPDRQNGWDSRCSMTSFAHTPARSLPRSTNRTVSGTRTRMSRVNQAFAMSVDPTPKAKQPSAPAMHVCESVPSNTSPGRVCPRAGSAAWQTPAK